MNLEAITRVVADVGIELVDVLKESLITDVSKTEEGLALDDSLNVADGLFAIADSIQHLAEATKATNKERKNG